MTLLPVHIFLASVVERRGAVELATPHEHIRIKTSSARFERHWLNFSGQAS